MSMYHIHVHCIKNMDTQCKAVAGPMHTLTVLSAGQVSGALMRVSHTSMALLTGRYRAPSCSRKAMNLRWISIHCTLKSVEIHVHICSSIPEFVPHTTPIGMQDKDTVHRIYRQVHVHVHLIQLLVHNYCTVIGNTQRFHKRWHHISSQRNKHTHTHCTSKWVYRPSISVVPAGVGWRKGLRVAECHGIGGNIYQGFLHPECSPGQLVSDTWSGYRRWASGGRTVSETLLSGAGNEWTWSSLTRGPVQHTHTHTHTATLLH